MNLLILGAGEQGRVVKEIAVYMGIYGKIAFLDDKSENAVGKMNEYEKFAAEYQCAFVAVGNPTVRKQFMDKLKEAGFALPALVHPDAYVSSSARISEGTVVMPKAAVQAGVRVGIGCIISAGAIVDHDSVIEDYCHINAGAIIPARSTVPHGTKVDYGMVFKG